MKSPDLRKLANLFNQLQKAEAEVCLAKIQIHGELGYDSFEAELPQPKSPVVLLKKDGTPRKKAGRPRKVVAVVAAQAAVQQ